MSNRKRRGKGGRGMERVCVSESAGGRHARIDVQKKICFLFLSSSCIIRRERMMFLEGARGGEEREREKE